MHSGQVQVQHLQHLHFFMSYLLLSLLKFSALNSFYDIRFEANEERQITQLKDFINQWNGKENIIFVTHFVVISSMLNIGTSSGEIVITDKNLNIIGSIDTL